MTAEELAGRFDGAKRGREWLARCPCHEDSSPSLGISEGRDGKVVVRCRAGCDTAAVLATVGLQLADLFPPNGNGAGRHVVATYDYRDEKGRLLYQVVRFDPKDFRQRRPSGDDWDWTLGDVRRVLYRLPELVAADPEEPVYIVEGEKDVDRLVELGLVATCNAGGAGKWRAEYTKLLASREVVIVPDNDEPGRQHVQAVASALAPVAVRVRVVSLPDLPPKGDVSDWLVGHGVDELRQLVSAAPAVDSARLADGTMPGNAPVRKPWRIASEYVAEIRARSKEAWISLELGGRQIVRCRPGGMVVIMGPSGGGKSSLTAALLVNHARYSGPAIYLSPELPGDELAARMIGMQCNMSWEDVLHGQLSDEHMMQALALPRLAIVERRDATTPALTQTITDFRALYPGEPLLFAVDYTQIFGGAPAQHEARMRLNSVIAELDQVARDYRAVGIPVNQMSRANAKVARAGDALGAETADMAAESAAIERYATVTLAIGGLKKVNEDGDQVGQLSVGKARMGGGDTVFPIRFEGRTGRFIVEGDARPAAEVRAELAEQKDQSKMDAACMAILGAAAQAREPCTRNDLIKAARVKRELGLIAIAKLIQQGDLVEVRIKKARSQTWMVCTPHIARAKQLPLLEETPQ